MNLQWTGSITTLQNELKKHGWTEPKALGMGSILQWLNPNVSLSELPILPHVHEGHHQDLLLAHPASTTDKQWVIRLWKTNITLTPSQQALWIGNISTQTIQHALGILHYPATTKDFNTPLSNLTKHLEVFRKNIKSRGTAKSIGNIQWNGDILLINSEPTKHKRTLSLKLNDEVNS